MQDYLRITELNYHPTDPTSAEQTAGYDNDDDFEFLELLNTGPVTLDLTGVQFIAGIDFTFPDAAQLDPGEFLVLASNPDAVQFRYGLQVDVAGQYAGRLANGGEQLTLADSFGAAIVDFKYGDSEAPGWPTQADGLGSSLEVIDVDGDYNDSNNWLASAPSPGSAPFGPTSPGDFDADGDVDGDDLDLWETGFGRMTGANLGRRRFRRRRRRRRVRLLELATEQPSQRLRRCALG